MSESGFNHKQIQTISIIHNMLSIQFGFKTSILEDNKASFLILNRKTENEKYLPFHTLDDENTIGSYEVTIDLHKEKDFFGQSGVWDVYIVVESEEDEYKRYRIVSNRQELNLIYYQYADMGTVFYPYTTNKMNLSLKTTKRSFISKVEDAYLSKDGLLNISGYVLDTKLMGAKHDMKKTLIITNHLDDEQYRLPLESVTRTDLTELYGDGIRNYDDIGFKGTFSIKEYLHTSELIYFRFYIELSYIDNGEEIVKVSPRLTFNPFNPLQSRRAKVIRIDGIDRRIFIKKTKVKSYLSVKVYVYNRSKEWKSRIRRKLTDIKRSRKIKALYKKAFKLMGYAPVRKKSVVFESFAGKQFSCNPRAIFEYMQDFNPEYKMYWSVDKKYMKNFEGRNLNIVPRFSIKWLFIMARAQYWVSNSRLPLWIPKPNHTTYLQTWHGTPLKKLAADMDEVHMPGTNTVKYKNNFLKEASNWDYLISPNAYSTEIFQRAFAFNKTMIESGYPRNDVLHVDNTAENMEALKQKFALPMDKKIILYAPTWRDNQFYGRGKYKFDLELDLNMLRDQLGDEYIVLLRMHYLVAENFDLTPYTGFAFDFSNYEDIRELYLVSDILVTDYSSVFFDYANLRRPMIFFVYDIEDYRDNLRGFYFEFEKTAPGPLVKTTEEVIQSIKEAEVNPISDKFNTFYDKFCYLEEGKSAERVVEEVFNKR